MDNRNGLSRFQVPETIRRKSTPGGNSTSQGFDYTQHLQNQLAVFNNTPGKLTGYDCPLCLNRGYTIRLDGEEFVRVDCACQEIRRSIRREKDSGLDDLLKTKTFSTYQTPQPWQQQAKALAQAYAEKTVGWFVAAGVSGSGKTHLCTAICGALLSQGKGVQYRAWRDTAREIKGAALDSQERKRIIEPLISVDVLYLDDFLKVANGHRPTDADVELAFDLLNSRYLRKATTILSTEWSVRDLLNLDGALGSRIFEMTNNGEWFLEISPGEGRNWRLTSHTDERSE